MDFASQLNALINEAQTSGENIQAGITSIKVGSPEYVKLIKSTNPKLWEGLKDSNIARMFSSGLHIKFEKADNNNDVAFFEKVKKKGWLPYLHAHYLGTKGCFEWENYESWDRMEKFHNTWMSGWSGLPKEF